MTPAMIYRAFARSGKIFSFELGDRHCCAFGCWDESKGGHDYTRYDKQYGFSWEGVRSDADGVRRLENFFRRMEQDGWRETERSLSYRIFWNTDQKPGKFWIISVEGNKVQIQFGRIPKHLYCWRPAGFGRYLEKEYSTREEALAAYHKAIEEKLAKGYVEINKRQTPYSRPAGSRGVRKRGTRKRGP